MFYIPPTCLSASASFYSNCLSLPPSPIIIWHFFLPLLSFVFLSHQHFLSFFIPITFFVKEKGLQCHIHIFSYLLLFSFYLSCTGLYCPQPKVNEWFWFCSDSCVNEVNFPNKRIGIIQLVFLFFFLFSDNDHTIFIFLSLTINYWSPLWLLANHFINTCQI